MIHRRGTAASTQHFRNNMPPVHQTYNDTGSRWLNPSKAFGLCVYVRVCGGWVEGADNNFQTKLPLTKIFGMLVQLETAGTN